MLFLKAAGALAAAALIGSAACFESPEAFDLSSPASEEYYAAAAASRAAAPSAAAAAAAAAAGGPTLRERLQALQDELRAWQEAQQTKMKTSHDELVALWRAAAAASQERIRLSHEMQAMNKEAVRDLLEAFFEWLRKLVTPVPLPAAGARPAAAGAAAADADTLEAAEARKEADKGLRQEAEALLQAIQEILQQGCGKKDDDDDDDNKPQQQQQQQQGRPQKGSGVAAPAPPQQQQQQQQHVTVASVVRDSQQQAQARLVNLFPGLNPEPPQTPEKPEGGDQQQQQPQEPPQQQPDQEQQQPQQPQQPDTEQVDPDVQGQQPGDNEQPIDPEFTFPAPEGEQLLPSLPNLPSLPASKQQMLLFNMQAAMLGAAVTQSVDQADATARRITAAVAGAAAASGGMVATTTFRGSSSSDSSSSKAEAAREILRELEALKLDLANVNAAAAADFAACDAAAQQQPCPAAEEQRLRVLKNWLIAINVFHVKLLHLSTRAQQLGIETGADPSPNIPQGYPLPRPEAAAPQEANPRDYPYAFYPPY